VLGFIGRRKEPAAKGMWLTGIILGFVGIAMALLSVIFWSIAFATFLVRFVLRVEDDHQRDSDD